VDDKVGIFVLQNNEGSAVYVMRERKAIAWAESVIDPSPRIGR
jgi:hypothetical protein